LTIHSLSKTIARQGVIVSFKLTENKIAQLVGFCITDKRPPGPVTSTNGAAPYVGDACGGVAASSAGTPQFVAAVDNGKNSLLQGWAIRNPPPKDPTGKPEKGFDMLTPPSGVCNFYYSWNLGYPMNLGPIATIAKLYAGQVRQKTAQPQMLQPPFDLGDLNLIDLSQLDVFSSLPLQPNWIPTFLWGANWNSGFADAAGLAKYAGIQQSDDDVEIADELSFVLPCQWTSYTQKTMPFVEELHGALNKEITRKTKATPKQFNWMERDVFIEPSQVEGVDFVNNPSYQKWGAKDAVLVSYASKSVPDPIGKEEKVTGTGNVMYANFYYGVTSLLGFQLTCDGGNVNLEKYVTISFFGRSRPDNIAASPFMLNYPTPMASSTTITDPPWASTSSPKEVLGFLFIHAICKNVPTTIVNIPGGTLPPNVGAGTKNTGTAKITQCEPKCKDPAYQEAVKNLFLEKCKTAGCALELTCSLSPTCQDLSSTANQKQTSAHRGLKQATLTFYLMTIFVTSFDSATVNKVANAVRAIEFWPLVSPFSAISLSWTDAAGQTSPVNFNNPSTSVAIQGPSEKAPWTLACSVFGTCNELPCAAQCNNGPIRKVTTYSSGEIACSCVTCEGNPKKTFYTFTSTACGGSADSTAADACCWNVMQDAICWAVETPGVLPGDLETISKWQYQPPSLGSLIPLAAKTGGPQGCPSSSNSSKGLLGLLGLLGLIPLLLCCCLLLLCLIRRKKREGDVHFATFDPNAAPVCASACAPVASACAPVYASACPAL
jgi:hypothetical protein